MSLVESREAPTMNRTRRILCLEDDPDTCEMLSVAFRLAGYSLIPARLPSDIIPLVRTVQFDCIILDVRLPGQSGLDLCREIRAFDQQIPIIFYTGAASEADKKAGLEAGAQVYLVKPVEIEVLIETVKILTSQRTM